MERIKNLRKKSLFRGVSFGLGLLLSLSLGGLIIFAYNFSSLNDDNELTKTERGKLLTELDNLKGKVEENENSIKATTDNINDINKYTFGFAEGSIVDWRYSHINLGKHKFCALSRTNISSKDRSGATKNSGGECLLFKNNDSWILGTHDVFPDSTVKCEAMCFGKEGVACGPLVVNGKTFGKPTNNDRACSKGATLVNPTKEGGRWSRTCRESGFTDASCSAEDVDLNLGYGCPSQKPNQRVCGTEFCCCEKSNSLCNECICK